MGNFDHIWVAVNELARTFRGQPWYCRSSFSETKLANGNWLQQLVLWGDVKKPADFPESFMGYPVVYNRVTKRHPCPFGSVKEG